MICTSFGNNINNTNNNLFHNKNSWKILRKNDNLLKNLWLNTFQMEIFFFIRQFHFIFDHSNDESHRRRKECNIGVDFKKGG